MTEPEKPTGSIALMSSSGSLLISDQADESITRVHTPVTPPRLVTVSGIGVGAGVMFEISNVKPLRVSTTLVKVRLTIDAVIVAAVMSRGKFVVAFWNVKFQYVFWFQTSSPLRMELLNPLTCAKVLRLKTAMILPCYFLLKCIAFLGR